MDKIQIYIHLRPISFHYFSFFLKFFPPGSGFRIQEWKWMRTHADPDPQPCYTWCLSIFEKEREVIPGNQSKKKNLPVPTICQFLFHTEKTLFSNIVKGTSTVLYIIHRPKIPLGQNWQPIMVKKVSSGLPFLWRFCLHRQCYWFLYDYWIIFCDQVNAVYLLLWWVFRNTETWFLNVIGDVKFVERYFIFAHVYFYYVFFESCFFVPFYSEFYLVLWEICLSMFEWSFCYEMGLVWFYVLRVCLLLAEIF